MPVTHYLWTQSLTSVIYTLPTGNGNNYIFHAGRWLNLPKPDSAQSCDSTVPQGLRILSTPCSLFPLVLMFLFLLMKMCKNINFSINLVSFNRTPSDQRDSSSIGKGTANEPENLSLVPETHTAQERNWSCKLSSNYRCTPTQGIIHKIQ